MSDRLISDLREAARFEDEYPVTAELHIEAADEIERLEAERDALRAELAAEREKTADYGKQIDRLADEVDWVEDEVVTQEKALEDVEAERDALRALLREAREYTGYAAFYGDGDRIEADHAVDLCARIDAALNKGGGIE